MTFLLPKQLNMQSTGLLPKDVTENRTRYGKNTLTQKPRKTFFLQFICAFNDPIIKILIIALVLNVIITFENANFYASKKLDKDLIAVYLPCRQELLHVSSSMVRNSIKFGTPFEEYVSEEILKFIQNR